MSATASRRYLVWRVADQPFPPGASGGREAFFIHGECESCGEPVWYQPANREPDMRLVCWPCAT